jgi:hypothetical protein
MFLSITAHTLPGGLDLRVHATERCESHHHEVHCLVNTHLTASTPYRLESTDDLVTHVLHEVRRLYLEGMLEPIGDNSGCLIQPTL